MRISAMTAIALLLLPVALAVAQEAPPPDQPPPDQPPQMPTEEQVRQQKADQAAAEAQAYVPLDVDFRIGVVGEIEREITLETGTQTQIKSPLVLFDPRTGQRSIYAKNFPARIVANSPNGHWVVGIAPSSAVEGSSGARGKECAVSLNLNTGDIKMIEEFPLHSSFQALFAFNDNNLIYYCVNEPGKENALTRYNLESQEKTAIPVEGNRFYLYGLTSRDPRAIWTSDPLYTKDKPVLDLVGLDKGEVIQTVAFPGASEILAQPSGDNLLAVVSSGAEASLGYFSVADKGFVQVPQLVLTKPTVKWLHNGMAVIAKESTSTRDRYLMIDLATGEARELFSGYFKTSYWDISPSDDALVCITDSEDAPVLFVVPLSTQADKVVNRITLSDVSNVTWIGCLNPPRSGSWLDRILPF